MSNTKNFEARVYEVYIHNEYKTGGSELRLMAWIVDGSEKPIRVERRDYFLDAEGNKKSGKAKGLTYEDITYILEHGTEIQNKMMGIKSDVDSAPKDDAKDEVPFA